MGALGVVRRGVTGARYGVVGWIAQRAAAVVMLVYTMLIVVLLVIGPGIDAVAWHVTFTAPWLRLASALFVLSLLLHAWVGVRDVLMDYVPATRLRLPLQVVVLLSLAGYALWALWLLWGGV